MVVRGAALSAGQFLGYDGAKKFFRNNNEQRKRGEATLFAISLEEGPLLHFVSSLSAAFFATTFCLPFDLILNRYANAKLVGKEYRNLLDCAVQNVRSDGVNVLFRGWTYMFVRVASIFCVYMPAYEQVRKRVLQMEYFK